MNEQSSNLGVDVRLAIFEQQLNTINEKQTTLIELSRQILAMRADMAVQEASHRDLKERVKDFEDDIRTHSSRIGVTERQISSHRTWIAGAAAMGVLVSFLMNWIVKTQIEPLVQVPQKVMEIEYQVRQLAKHEAKENDPTAKP